MTNATEYKSDPFIKLLYIGNSGTGKTGSLASLVAAGYKLRIIDGDAGLAPLFNFAPKELLSTIEFQSYRDKMKMSPTGPRVVGAPKAYANTLSALERWPDDESDPATWGSEYILVIDSLTAIGKAAYRWARAVAPDIKDPRQWYKTAQELLEDLLDNATSEDFKTNVIVISHIDVVKGEDGLIRGFPSTIGKAIGPKVGRYFNTLISAERKGTGDKAKRKINTLPTALLDLKSEDPQKILGEYELATGMAEIFAALRS